MLRRSARFRIGYTAPSGTTATESQSRSRRTCLTRPRARRDGLQQRIAAGRNQVEPISRLYQTRANTSRVLATQATGLLHSGACHCAQCHAPRVEALPHPGYLIERPNVSLHRSQQGGSRDDTCAGAGLQAGSVSPAHDRTRDASKWQSNLVIDRPAFTTADLQNIDTEYVRMMVSQAMDFLKDRNWSSARTQMARAERRWHSNLNVDRPGFTTAQLQYIEINEVIQMADNAMAAFDEKDWSVARNLMLCAQSLWRKAQRLWHEGPVIKMPAFSAHEERHMDVDNLLRCANQARRLLLRDDIPEAEDAMSQAQRMWYQSMGIPFPEFSQLEQQRITAVKTQRLDMKARSFLSQQNRARAGEVMRKAQTCWRKGCEIPIPAFSVEEQSQIQAVCPSLKLLCRGRLTDDLELDCPICWNTEADASYILGPCRHWFHDRCISEWLKSSVTCPNCRNKWL